MLKVSQSVWSLEIRRKNVRNFSQIRLVWFANFIGALELPFKQSPKARVTKDLETS